MGKDRTILVLEDSDEDFETVVEALGKAGQGGEIFRAATGDECLGLLRGPLRPEMLMLDLNTPGLDGRDVLRVIKSDPNLRKLPVIVFTTSSNPLDLQLCYSIGVNAYHLKPLAYLDHLNALRQVFSYWLGRVCLPGYPGPRL